MRAARTIIAASAAACAMPQATAQTPYPELTLQDVAWTSGTHHTAVTNRILAPGTPDLPVEITGTADAEFVSATSVRLAPGFHAGAFNGGGRFRARIDQALGSAAELVLIAPDPETSLVSNVLHVPKWEKLELGLKLPAEYQGAIDRFFEHYYSDANDPDVATPWEVDATRDLNPYADDSLQLLLTLVDPDNTTRLKWGFFMKEGRWVGSGIFSQLAEDYADPLHPYCIHFRVSPDLVGLWHFTVSLKAPHTLSLSETPLPQSHMSGYTFVCNPPLEDNKGPLSVNEANRRSLKTATDEPFFALGTNLNPSPLGIGWNNPNSYRMTKGAFDNMVSSISLLKEAGGNFIRTWLSASSFAAEHVNVGVYDRFRNGLTCDADIPVIRGNGQYQAWAFDQILDLARTSGIYTQLTVVPYPPIIAYESFAWHNDGYLNRFVKPRDPVTNLYDLKRYFYLDGDVANKDVGPFYYWKRYYKYLMARWGYSVNLAIIEPFQEIDQMLTYNTVDLTTNPGGTCAENQLVWLADPDLPNVISTWVSDISDYVRGEHELTDPVSSPMNEDDKLFLMSYAGGPGWVNQDQQFVDNYYRPFLNEDLDLMDVHLGLYSGLGDQNQPGRHQNGTFINAQGYWNRFPSENAPLAQRKPFNQGEHTHYTQMDLPGWSGEIENVFHNYDVSFHNEIWTSAFSGKFAAGTSWNWGRVFWKPNPTAPPQTDYSNAFQQSGFSNTFPGENALDIGLDEPVVAQNRPVHHHFKPLADLLTHPSWLYLGFFDGDYTANKVFDDNDAFVLESYYLKNADNNTAIGWVHNRNAWLMNSFYLTSGVQNFLGCNPPNAASQILTLPGFDDSQEYYVTWFPTRWNMTDLPPDSEEPLPDTDNDPSTVTLDLTGRFGGTVNNYLDTLRSDYAFIITPEPFVKSLRRPAELEETSIQSGWDFSLFPNPTRDVLHLRFPTEGSKTIAILDLAGRNALGQASTSASSFALPLDDLAKGMYCVRVSNGENTKTKKLIIH